MKKKYDQVYQLKITLKGTKPPIWRRIQVPESYTFWDLHVAIQDAMGWEDYHLHEFVFTLPIMNIKVRIGIPMEDDFDETILPDWDQKIADYFSSETPKAEYTYDFGDGWQHDIILEKILPRKGGVIYPRCVDGKRACPPEDCGGIGGYQELLEAFNSSDPEQHQEAVMWLGEDFEPEDFESNDVEVEDSYQRLKLAFG